MCFHRCYLHCDHSQPDVLEMREGKVLIIYARNEQLSSKQLLSDRHKTKPNSQSISKDTTSGP